MDAQHILVLLAAGKEVAGINGAIFSATMRNAFAEGARAIAFKRSVSALLTPPTSEKAVEGKAKEPAATPEPARPPKPPAEVKAPPMPKPAPKPLERPVIGTGARWSADEDARVVKAFKEKVPLEQIAMNHQRTPYAIALRLHKPHGLMTEQEVERVKADRREKLAASASAREVPPAEAEAFSRIPEGIDDLGFEDDLPVLTDVIGDFREQSRQ